MLREVYDLLTGSNRIPESPTWMVLLVREHPSGHVTLWIKINTGLIGGDTIRRIGTNLGEQFNIF